MVGQKYVIRNYMIDLLAVLLPTYLKEHSNELGAYIDSPEFIFNLKVSTLNRIAPKYVTSVAGEVFSAFAMRESQHNVDFMIALSNATAEVISQMKDNT